MTALLCKTLLVGALIVSGAASQAMLTTFSGIRDTNSTAAPSGGAKTARDAFADSAFVVVTGTESFTGLAGPQPFLGVLGGAANINCVNPGDPTFGGGGPSCNLNNVAGNGRYDTTGDGGGAMFLESNVLNDPSGPIVITFTAAAGNSAFGFYGTDIGDFGSGFSVMLTDLDGGTSTFDLVAQGDSPSESNLQFFGFYDNAKAYRSVTLLNFDGNDGFAIDDLIIGNFRAGTPPSGVPEPMTPLLALVALAAAGGARRLRR